MTNLIGNVLKFTNLDEAEILEHEHIHFKNDKHKHTVEYFTTELKKLNELLKKETNFNKQQDIQNRINVTNKNLQDVIKSLPDTTTKNFIGNKKDTTEPHLHKHIHINKGEEQSSNVKDECSLYAENVPTNIHNIMIENDNIKTYKQSIINNKIQHELILSDIITTENLNTIIESLKTLKYTNFYTGHLHFNLEYTENQEIKSEPYKINILGNNATLHLKSPLSTKNKSYLKNINVEGYYFDSDANARCTTSLIIKNTIPSLIIDTYDMTDEFCI